MAVKTRADLVLFGTTLGLVAMGLLMTFSASALVAHETHRSSFFFLARQSVWAALGTSSMLAAMRLDYRKLNHRGVLYASLGITVVLLTVVLALPAIKGSHRWIRWGIFSFQPSEFAKLTLVLYLAHQLERRLDRLEQLRTGIMGALVIPTVLVALVLVEPDVGTAFCLGAVAFVSFFVAGVPLRHLAGIGLATVPVLILFITRVRYVVVRLLAFVDPWSDPLGAGFQLIQSLIAVGTGGLFGLGFMQSKQKLFYLPEPHTDFVFSVISEEFGFAGAISVLALFSVILWRGLHVAGRAPDAFGTLLAAGLTSVVVVQAYINVGVVLGLLPTTGIPLPFISAGGSSMVVSLTAIGLVLSVSQHAR